VLLPDSKAVSNVVEATIFELGLKLPPVSVLILACSPLEVLKNVRRIFGLTPLHSLQNSCPKNRQRGRLY